MVAQGLVVRTEQLRGDIVQMRDIKNDIKMNLYTGDYAVHFVNIDKPDDFMTVTINAHAADAGDKSPGKCCSYAVKYALLKTFSLETGESDESRMFEEPQFTDIQKETFDKFIDDNNDGLGFVCFQATVGEGVVTALNSSFGKGNISSGKTTVRKLEREGWDILKESALQIGKHIDNSDSSGILEVVSELEPVERKLLAGLLSPGEIQHIKQAQELSA
jgi:hypothetical protein